MILFLTQNNASIKIQFPAKIETIHLIHWEILHHSLMLTFHLEPIIKSVLLAEQKGIITLTARMGQRKFFPVLCHCCVSFLVVAGNNFW
jgi:hypothetical protein